MLSHKEHPIELVFAFAVPTIIGVLVGIALAYSTGMSAAATLAIIGGLFGLSALVILFGCWPRRRIEDMLFFLGVFTLVLTFVDINFGFREGWPYQVLVNGFRVSLSDLLIFLLAIIWWLNPERMQVRQVLPKTLVVLFALSLLWGGANSAFVARDSFFAWSVWWRELKIILILIFLARFLEERHFKLLGYALAAGLVLQFIAVVDQKYLGPVVFTADRLKTEFALKSVAGAGYIMRYSGTLGHPNTLASFIVVSVLWIWFMIPSLQSRLKQALLVGVLGLAFITLILTGSRGGWLGLGLALSFGIMAWMKRTGKSLIAGVIVTTFSLLTIVGSLWVLSETFRDRLTKDDQGSAEVRQPLNEVALNIIGDATAFGVGYGSYTSVMNLHDTTLLRVTTWFDFMVHNWILLTAAEIGVVGLLIHLSIVFLMMWYGWQVFLHGDRMFADAGLTTLGATLGWFLQQMTNPDYYFMPVYLWFVWAATLAARRIEIQRGTMFK